jgi:cytochrome P450
LVNKSQLLYILDYADTWDHRRTRRRLIHQALDGAAARRFQPQVLEHAHDLLRRLLDTPEVFAEHFDQFVICPATGKAE